jgi:hypothetical protein
MFLSYISSNLSLVPSPTPAAPQDYPDNSFSTLQASTRILFFENSSQHIRLSRQNIANIGLNPATGNLRRNPRPHFVAKYRHHAPLKFKFRLFPTINYRQQPQNPLRSARDKVRYNKPGAAGNQASAHSFK